MYEQFHGLSERPFSITPDPRYLYMSARHAEALSHLLYGVRENGGFTQLTGEVGTGKTLLVRCLLERLPDRTETAIILDPPDNRLEFLEALCRELRVRTPRWAATPSTLGAALNRKLLRTYASGRRTVLIVDEAQALKPELLEQVRRLTNLETARHKLLGIVLVGQPELHETLGRSDLRQLAQRITARCYLGPLSRLETGEYLQHRLKVAGASGEVFSSRAKRLLHRISRGIPRIINVVADRALLGAFVRRESEVGGSLVRLATREVYGRGGAPHRAVWSGAAG
ncbi:MAG: AAA family ATPase [Gammaproteobacteria bacterium]|nr:AAA family ATPase [Gammaproteobacteria bacterium]